MNRLTNNSRLIKVMLSAVAATSMCNAHAQRGMLEIHGVLISPGCQLKLQDMQQLIGKTHVNGQACGLTTGPGNALTQATIALVAEETTASLSGAGKDKRLMTLSYR
jgi:hypothetical protein